MEDSLIEPEEQVFIGTVSHAAPDAVRDRWKFTNYLLCLLPASWSKNRITESDSASMEFIF